MEHVAKAAAAVVDAALLVHATLGISGCAALGGLLYAVVQALRVWKSDCDLTLAAAARRLPGNAFDAKVAWITGASSGIGEALAYELAQRGASLVLSARRIDKLIAVQTRCHELGAPEVLVQKLDVEDTASHAAIVAAVLRKFKRIDYLINNAGRSQRGLVERTPLDVDRALFELNVFGTLSITKAVLPAMLAAGGGVIANTSSVAGKVGSPISATYAASKHAIQGYFDSLRMELGYRGVRVVNVCPGPVQSEISLHAFTETAGAEHGESDEAGTNRMPAQRCAVLYAAALWAELPEVWIAPQPILLFTYLGQYCKWAYFYMGVRVAGPKRVEAFRGGNSGYASLQSVSGLFSAAAAGPGAAADGHKKAK